MELPDAVYWRNLWILISMIFQINYNGENTETERQTEYQLIGPS